MKHSGKNKIKDHMVSQEEFSLVIDSEVPGLMKTMPRPSRNDLPAYYKSDEYISHTDSQKSLMDKVYQKVKGYNLKYKEGIIAKSGVGKKVLDYGCGTGDFVKFLNQKGYDAWGYEPNEDARKIAEAKKGVQLVDEYDVFEQTYDAITLWHVLEHIPDYSRIIEYLINSLSKEGKLWVAVPNYKSFDAQFYKKEWAAYDVPRHLWHFSREAISHIYENFGMIIEREYPMYFDAFYVSLLSEKYRKNPLGIIRAPMVGMASNLMGMMTGNYSSIIYQIGFKTK